MLGKDPVTLTEAYPKMTLQAKRLRAAITGKTYFFNGQKNRARVFRAIDSAIPFENYIETGTFLGMTTDFLSRTAMARGGRVLSCELNDRHFAIANRTVGHRRNVHLRHANSVDFLESLRSDLSQATNFVYLDAHWGDYLPLRDELSILKEWPNTVVLIDDCKVPSDLRFSGTSTTKNERYALSTSSRKLLGDRGALLSGAILPRMRALRRPGGYAVLSLCLNLFRGCWIKLLC